MTSSPGIRRRSPSLGEVSAESASRLADDPELMSTHSRTPIQRANSRSNCSAKRPVVSQKSSDESTSDCISAASKTLPETGTLDSPGTKRRARELLRVVFANQLENLRPKLLAAFRHVALHIAG